MFHKTVESEFITIYNFTYVIIFKSHRSIYRLFLINKIVPNIVVY